MTGAQAIFKDLGVSLDSVKISDLGTAKKIIIDADNTTIVSGAGEKKAIEGRAEQIRREIETTDSDYDREKLQERLAKLAGGVAQINVGAATETEMKERKALLEDAQAATQAALEEGIVPGGGVALLRSVKAVEKLSLEGDEALGAKIVQNVLDAPVAGDRRERRPGRRRGGQPRPADEGQGRRLRRRAERLLRPGRGRHHRPGQGRAHRAAERRQRRGAAADHLGAWSPRFPKEETPQAPGRKAWAAAWAAWAAWAEAWAAWVAWAAWEASEPSRDVARSRQTRQSAQPPTTDIRCNPQRIQTTNQQPTRVTRRN